MTKKPRTYTGKSMVSKIKDAGEAGQAYEKGWNWTTLSYHTQHLGQNRLKTWI